jgi:hypothetical protein
MRVLINCSAMALAALAQGLTARPGDDEKVPLDKVPAAVTAAAQAKYPKAKITTATKGDQDGTKVYELELTEGGRK